MRQRKSISQPSAYWAAFESAARAEGLTVSQWLAACGIANLPQKVQDQLPERPKTGRPRKVEK